jgi:hypothetical protein
MQYTLQIQPNALWTSRTVSALSRLSLMAYWDWREGPWRTGALVQWIACWFAALAVGSNGQYLELDSYGYPPLQHDD